MKLRKKDEYTWVMTCGKTKSGKQMPVERRVIPDACGSSRARCWLSFLLGGQMLAEGFFAFDITKDDYIETLKLLRTHGYRPMKFKLTLVK